METKKNINEKEKGGEGKRWSENKKARIGRVSWKAKKTNKEVLNKLGLQSTKLMTVVRQRIVRFYGHVRRHDSLQRIITEGNVNGKRGRGRKRCGWLGNVS